MRFFGRLLLSLFVLAGLVLAAVLGMFTHWRGERLAALAAGAEVIQTPLGAVEVADSGGDGPALLVLHGAGGGYDQAQVVAESLAQAGCRVLAWSRPGYLRTPLAAGIFPEQQADLAAALLHTLQVPQAALLVCGEATPVGLHALLRHPDIFSRAAFLSPLPVRTFVPPRGAYQLPIEWMSWAFNGDLAGWWTLQHLALRPRSAVYDLLLPGSSWSQFGAWQAAGAIAEHPPELAWARRFFQSYTPSHPREVGLRNDVAQMRGLPEIPVAQIKAPLLVVMGEKNPFGPPSAITSIFSASPSVQFLELPETGWILPGLGPESKKLARILAEFFAAPRPVPEPSSE